jgi:hypothetical protein
MKGSPGLLNQVSRSKQPLDQVCGICVDSAWLPTKTCPHQPPFTEYLSTEAETVCKTVGSAYVGSNPTPATTSENSPHQREHGEGLSQSYAVVRGR